MPGKVGVIDASVSGVAASTSASGGGARGAAGTKPATAAAPMPGTPATVGARSGQHSNGESHLVAVPFSGRTVRGHLSCRPCFVRSGGPLAALRRTRGSSSLAGSLSNSNRREGRRPGVAATERVGGAPGGSKTSSAAATATAAARTSRAPALRLRGPAIYKTLAAGHRKGRGRGAGSDRDAHAVGTSAPKAAAAVAARNPVSAAQGGKTIAVTLVVKTEKTAPAPATRPLETIAANASAGRAAMIKAQGASTSGAVASSASTVNREVTGIQGGGRRKPNIRGLIYACILGSALLFLHMVRFSDQPVPLFAFFEATNRQEEVAVPSWLPCSFHSRSCKSGSNISSSSGSRGLYGLYKPSTRRGCCSGVLEGGSGNKRSFRLLFRLRRPSSDKTENYFRSRAARSCTCNGSGRNINCGYSDGKSTGSTSIYRRTTTRTITSSCRKSSSNDSGSGSRGPLQLARPCLCSGTHRKTFKTTSSTIVRTTSSSEKDCFSTIGLLNGSSSPVWSSYAYSSASTLPSKKRTIFEGTWLLFAVADVSPDLTARSEGAAPEHTVAGRMEDCVCPRCPSSPGIDRSQAETTVVGRFETEQNRGTTVQRTQQQHVEEPQLPAQDEEEKLQLPPNQHVAELEPRAQHMEKGDKPQRLEEQQGERLDGQQKGEANGYVGGQEAAAEAGGPQPLQQQLEQPTCEHQGCVVSDMEGIVAAVPVAEEGEKEEDGQQLQQLQGEGVEEQPGLDGDQVGQPYDIQNAEGAYLNRQQAVSAAVSGLLPVGRHYDFMPLTKRLSTAKRLNLLEESECYEEYFSGDVTEATDAERSRSESADAVTGEGDGARTAARSPQDTVEDSLGTGEGPATATEEEGKTEGEREGKAQQVAASEEDAVRKAGAAGGERGAEASAKVSSNAVQIENPSIDTPALAVAGDMAEIPEAREILCREELEKASCGTAAAGTRSRVGSPQRELQKEAAGEAETGAAIEESPPQGDKTARKQSTEVYSSPLPTAVVDCEQEQGSREEVAAGTARDGEQAAVAASNQREQLLVSQWHRVAPDDIDIALPLDATAALAAAGHTPQRPSPVYKTCTSGELLRGAEEETASSEGEEEDGDDGEDDDEDDLTSRLPIRHRPLVTLELTSAGFEDIGAAERGPRGAHESSFSAAVDAFSAAPPSGHAPAGTPAPHVVTAPGTYSYSGVTVGSPLPSSYATLPLLLSAYNAAVPPGVLPGLTVPPNVTNFPPAPAFLSPTLPPTPVSDRPTLLPVQLPAAAAADGNPESRSDDSPSNRVGFVGSNTSPAFMPQPVALGGSPTVAASASPAPPRTTARPTSARNPHDAAGAPPPSHLSSTASSAAPVWTAAHALDGDSSWNAFQSAAAAAARAAMPQAAPQHVTSRSHVVTTPATYATDANAPRAPADASALPAGSGSSSPAPSSAPAVGGAATSSPAAFVSHVLLPANATEPQADAFWTAASATFEHYPAGEYPATPYYPATNYPPVAHYSDAAYPGADLDRPVPLAPKSSGVALHAGEPTWADQNIAVSGGRVERLEELRRRGVGSTDGSIGVLQAHAATGEGVAANSGISHNTFQRAARPCSPPDSAAAVPEFTAGTSSTGGDTAILAATMAAAAAAQARASAAAGDMQRLDSAALADRHTRAAKAKAALAKNTGCSEDRKTAAAHRTALLQPAEESPFLPGEQTPRRLYEGPEQQKFKSVDPRLPLRSAAAASPSGAAVAENERTGGAAAEARVQKRGRAAASEVHQRQKVTRRNTAAGTTAHGRGDKAGGGGTAAAGVASGPEAVLDDSLRQPSSAAGTLSTTAHASAAGGRGVALALRKSGAAAARAGAEAEGAAAAAGAREALVVRDAPTGGRNVGFSRHGGAKDEVGGDPPDFGRDVYHPDAASEPVTLSSTGATSSLAEASFKKPSDALKNLVARQDAGEWQHERDAFERHYPFKKPLLIRSTTTGRVFEIAFDSVLGAGGQGVVFAATILSEGTGVALKIFRIRPDQRRDDGREEGMLRRRVQSELNVWDFIPGGLSPREWSEFAHLVIPLDVVQPLKIHKSPPRHEVRYATQWIMMDLFAGDMARMPKIMNASASVKMEVTEQMFLVRQLQKRSTSCEWRFQLLSLPRVFYRLVEMKKSCNRSNMRLHDMGLVHSDIKLPNFFIGMDGRIFLGDHSLATIFWIVGDLAVGFVPKKWRTDVHTNVADYLSVQAHKYLYQQRSLNMCNVFTCVPPFLVATPIGENVPCMSGTVRYLPPENMKCINDGRRRIMTTERKDVWALGIVLYKLWCGQQYPYEIGDLWSRDLFVRAARAHVDELDLTGCDKMATVPILGLLRIMLTPQVSKRPTLREIHKFHPLFAPQKNTLLRSRTLHSLLEEIQSGRGNFDSGKFTGSLPVRHALFGGVDLKR